jgi:CDGSH-type Zn-finger protein
MKLLLCDEAVEHNRVVFAMSNTRRMRYTGKHESFAKQTLHFTLTFSVYVQLRLVIFLRLLFVTKCAVCFDLIDHLQAILCLCCSFAGKPYCEQILWPTTKQGATDSAMRTYLRMPHARTRKIQPTKA